MGKPKVIEFTAIDTEQVTLMGGQRMIFAKLRVPVGPGPLLLLPRLGASGACPALDGILITEHNRAIFVQATLNGRPRHEWSWDLVVTVETFLAAGRSEGRYSDVYATIRLSGVSGPLTAMHCVMKGTRPRVDGFLDTKFDIAQMSDIQSISEIDPAMAE